MITVIIAGGSGTRLWPLSTSGYPKHLLKLVGERTLLQATYDRAAKLGKDVYIVTESGHAQHIRAQLPELPDTSFLIEPGRRGTAHCIVFALDVIRRTGNMHEPIAFIHADHFIRDTESFVRSLTIAGNVSTQYKNITLVGIEPTFPSIGLGYIERGERIDLEKGAYRVGSFKEKPNFETALGYVDSGNYLWNCGYFVGSVQTFDDEIGKSSPDLEKSITLLHSVTDYPSSDYNETYLSLDTQIIDYALSERSDNLAVIGASFDWLDVGSYKDLHEAVNKDQQENYIQGNNIHALEVENVYIRNEEEKPVVVIGLDNIVVVNTPDGILISRKDVSHRVGEVAKKIQERRNT